MTRRGLILVCLAGTLLAACRPARLPDLSALPGRPDDFPGAEFQRYAESADGVYRLDPSASWMHLRIGRDGRLKRLGHNHIVSTRALFGWAASAGDELRALAYVPVAELEVDRPELRAAAGEGFESEVSDSDRQGTRANMLGPGVLHAEAHPFLKAEVILGEEPVWRFQVRGEWSQVPVEADIRREGNRLVATGHLTLTHQGLGIEPFSALGGAIRVAEAIEVSFHIEAERPTGP